MNFKELLQDFPSKQSASIIAKSIIDQPQHIPSLWKFAKSDHKYAWRGAWIMDKMYDRAPELIRPYIPEMIKTVESLTSEGQQRQFLKLISLEPLPMNVSGKFINACFDWMNSALSPVAIRVYAMQILYNFTLHEPDLKQEVALCIETHMEFGTAGFKSRGKKILKALAR
ncbi:MAG: hypothetical protein ACEPOZ_15260 [Marinifilaceae bacterium]